MTVFKPERVSVQPIVEMSHWSFRKATDEDGYTTKHLVGCVNGFGRVSSAVEDTLEKDTIRTSSGRVYKLIGTPSKHMDAEYVWGVWLEANNCWEMKQ